MSPGLGHAIEDHSYHPTLIRANRIPGNVLGISILLDADDRLVLRPEYVAFGIAEGPLHDCAIYSAGAGVGQFCLDR